MSAFLNEIINPVNLHATFLVVLVMFYWLLVIFGAVGLETFDLDADLDIDLDLDVDIDADLDIHVGESLFGALLTFFHLGEVPVMLVASIFSLFFWLATIMANHFQNPDLHLLTAAVWMLPCIVVSLIATKLAVMPIAAVLREEKLPYEKRTNLVGVKAEVHSLKLDESFGEIAVQQDGPLLVLNAKTENGQRLQKGDIVKITRINEANHCIVELAKWESKEI